MHAKMELVVLKHTYIRLPNVQTHSITHSFVIVLQCLLFLGYIEWDASLSLVGIRDD